MLIRHISSFNRVFKKPSPNLKVGSECYGGFLMCLLVCIILITLASLSSSQFMWGSEILLII